MLPEGNYFATLVEGVTDTAKSGNEQVVVKFDITHRAVAGAWDPLDKAEQRSLYMSLTDAAWPYSKDKLAALGFNGDFGPGIDFGDAVKAEGVELVCRHETRDGKLKEKWELANWGTKREAAPPPADKVRALNARWKQANVAPKPAGKPPMRQPSEPPMPVKPDDGNPV